MEVTLAGMVRSCSAVQLWNASWPMVCTVPGSFRVVNLSQYMNALSGTEVILVLLRSMVVSPTLLLL